MRPYPTVISEAARAVRHIRGLDVPAATVRSRDDLSERVVALTFDDGPSEWTEPILDTLRDAGARATFFVIGDAVRGMERILRRIVAEGHEVGNHTMRHPWLDEVRRRRVRHELVEANRVIHNVIGARPTVFRPPSFRRNVAVLEVARSLGFDPVVLASVLTNDHDRDDEVDIVEALLPFVGPGAIIDLHDGRPPDDPPRAAGGTRDDRWPTVKAVPLLLSALSDYQFVTVSDLLARV